jgi:hypothetical protein
MQAWTGSEGSSMLRHSEFLDRQHMKITRLLSALRTGRFCPSCVTPGTHFCYRLSRPLSIFGIQLFQSQFIGRRLRVDRPVNLCSIAVVRRYTVLYSVATDCGAHLPSYPKISRSISSG